MTATPSTLVTRSPDGHRLAARVWADGSPRAVLVVAHGHGEHGGCYAELAGVLGASLPIDVVAFDFRGHGRSEGKRGVLRRYPDLLDDLDVWLQRVAVERPGLPVFVLGHSNGGLAAIRLVETRPVALAGLILSNPSLRLIARAPLWKRLAGRVLLRVAPWVTLETGISHDQLTQAADAVAQLEADPLLHQRISPPTYFGMIANGPLAIDGASQMTTPTLLILGAADPIADPAAGQQFFDRLGAADKTLQVYNTMRHEPIHEVDRAAVHAAIIGWIGARLADSSHPAPLPSGPPGAADRRDG